MSHNIDRRQFLSTGAGLLGLLAAGSYSPTLRAQSVQDDYRALVLVFQYGGVDCHDVIIPYDNGAYNEYATIRAGMEITAVTARSAFFRVRQPRLCPAAGAIRLSQFVRGGPAAVVGTPPAGTGK